MPMRCMRGGASFSLYRRRCSNTVSLVLLTILLLVFQIDICAASMYLVVDVDGAVEDYAALTTILRHSSARGQLALVTVNGNSWGNLKATEANVKRFLTLAGKASVVQVAIGGVHTLADVYNDTSKRADCAGTQGFPKTPFEAKQRGMKISKLDIDRSFGAMPQLPWAGVDPAILSTSLDATTALLNLLNGLTIGERVVYLALSSLTNLASLLKRASALGQSAKVTSTMEVHCYENNNNWALDPIATNTVLRSPGLSVVLYTPNLWKTSVTYSVYSWGLFVKTAAYSQTSAEVKWLAQAWSAKKFHFDGGSTTSTTFFAERGPASSLVTMCVIDPATRTLCQRYMSSPTTAMLTYIVGVTSIATPNPTDPLSSTTTSISYSLLTGNNVTSVSYLQYPSTFVSRSSGQTILLQDGGNNVVVVDTAASIQWPGQPTLVTQFWNAWTGVLSH